MPIVEFTSDFGTGLGGKAPHDPTKLATIRTAIGIEHTVRARDETPTRQHKRLRLELEPCSLSNRLARAYEAWRDQAIDTHEQTVANFMHNQKLRWQKDSLGIEFDAWLNTYFCHSLAAQAQERQIIENRWLHVSRTVYKGEPLFIKLPDSDREWNLGLVRSWVIHQPVTTNTNSAD